MEHYYGEETQHRSGFFERLRREWYKIRLGNLNPQLTDYSADNGRFTVEVPDRTQAVVKAFSEDAYGYTREVYVKIYSDEHDMSDVTGMTVTEIAADHHGMELDRKTASLNQTGFGEHPDLILEGMALVKQAAQQATQQS